jgi:hypothetical protein
MNRHSAIVRPGLPSWALRCLDIMDSGPYGRILLGTSFRSAVPLRALGPRNHMNNVP